MAVSLNQNVPVPMPEAPMGPEAKQEKIFRPILTSLGTTYTINDKGITMLKSSRKENFRACVYLFMELYQLDFDRSYFANGESDMAQHVKNCINDRSNRYRFDVEWQQIVSYGTRSICQRDICQYDPPLCSHVIQTRTAKILRMYRSVFNKILSAKKPVVRRGIADFRSLHELPRPQTVESCFRLQNAKK